MAGIEGAVVVHAGKGTVFARHVTGDLRRSDLFEQVAQQVGRQDQKRTMDYPPAQLVFHCVVDNRVIYLCAVRRDPAGGAPQLRRPFAFLEDVKNRFCTDYGVGGPMCPPDPESLTEKTCKGFNNVLKERINWHNDSGNDKISAVQDKIEQVRGVMIDNIEKALARGERVDDLVQQTENLTTESRGFKKSSTQLRRNVCMRHYRIVALAILVFLCLGALIMLIICKFRFNKSPCDWS